MHSVYILWRQQKSHSLLYLIRRSFRTEGESNLLLRPVFLFGEKSNLPDFRKHGQSLAVAAVAVIVVVVEVVVEVVVVVVEVAAAAVAVAVVLVVVALLHDRIIIQYCKSMPNYNQNKTDNTNNKLKITLHP